MSRIRTIKPSFFKSDDVSALPLRARLTWIGLWTQCDDQGRTKDHVKLIKADVWPLDQVSLSDIEDDLRVLAEQGRIVRYRVGGERYLAVTNWGRHQRINRPSASSIPPPPAATDDRAAGPGIGRHHIGPAPAEQYVSEPRGTVTDNSVNPHGTLTDGSPGEGKGREGKGRDARTSYDSDLAVLHGPASEPPRNCPEHLNDRNPPPCGACRGARENFERWHADRRSRLAAAPDCTRHRGQPAHNCAMCRSEALGVRTGSFPLVTPKGASA